MASPKTYNSRSSSVKRLLAEAKELASLADDGIYAAPLEENLHEFHFCIRGPADTEFDGGIYHGRIILPPQYPFKAPDIMLMTPNGRFELNKKVCLTITGFHEESWQPAWGIRTALVGLSSFFTTEAKGAIGGLDAPASERKRLAAVSKDWSCPTCQMKNSELLPPPAPKLDKGKGKAEGAAEDEEPVKPSETAKEEAARESEPATRSEAKGLEVDRPEMSPASSQETVKFLPNFSSSTPSPSANLEAVHTGPVSSPSPGLPAAAVSMSMSHPATASNNSIRPSPAMDRRQQVVNLLTDQLNLGLGGENPQPLDMSGQDARRGQGASPPPVWLDGMIGCVLIALASLLCRKMM